MKQYTAFELYFDELPDELVEDKVNEVITFRFENDKYPEDLVDGRTLTELLEDEELRLKTLWEIDEHFPYMF